MSEKKDIGFHLRTSITLTGATGTVAWDWKSGDADLDLMLDEDVMLSAPTGLRHGCIGRLIVRGTYVLTFGAGYGMTTIRGNASGPLHLLFRATSSGSIERISINTGGGAAVSKAVAIDNFPHNHSITHGLGSATGLPDTGYFLELRGYSFDAIDGSITGIKATKTGPDTATIQLLDTTTVLTGGTLIFTAIPY